MERKRKQFAGVINILKFNKHFYITAVLGVSFLLLLSTFVSNSYSVYFYVAAMFIAFLAINSLLASYYVYDVSDLYEYNWIKKLNPNDKIINIVAGYDESTLILQSKFPECTFETLDFYESLSRKEKSLKEARLYTQVSSPSKSIRYSNINVKSAMADKVFVIFSAHEIRNNHEKVKFLNEISRILKPEGEVYVVEHLRDLANFCAYSIGFFHFFSKKTWLGVFRRAGLEIQQHFKVTPFVSVFILKKNGNTY